MIKVITFPFVLLFALIGTPFVWACRALSKDSEEFKKWKEQQNANNND